MKTLLMPKCLLLLAGFFTMLFQHRDNTVTSGEPQLEFQIATDQSEYVPGDQMNLRFFIINHGKIPVYLPRDISYCVFWSGHFDLQILDEKGRNVVSSGCSAEHLPMSSPEILQEMQDPRQWVLLKPN